MPDANIPIRWQPDRAPKLPPWPDPPFTTALLRGVRGLCPACGQTHIFKGYLRVVPRCMACSAPLGEVRADDAPPYFTIFIVGHIVVGLMFGMERAYEPPYWLQAAIWVPVTILLSMALLRPIKGATVAWMLKLGMMKPAEE